MSPEQITNYLQLKAEQSQYILHVPDSDKDQAFFVIDDPYDLNEFDESVRSLSKSPAMLFELEDGSFDNQNSILNTVNCSFMILDRLGANEKVRDCRNRCYNIGKSIIKTILKDVREMNIIPDKMVNSPLNGNYMPVGKIDTDYYGYQFSLQFIGPDSFC